MILKGRRLKPEFVKRIKRGISYILALFLIVGLFGVLTPVTAKAEGETHIHDGIEFQPWTSTNSMPSSGNWYLVNDVTLPSNWEIYDTDVCLCLNGHNLTMGGVDLDSTGCIHLYYEAHLKLYDEDNTGSVTTACFEKDASWATVVINSDSNNVFEMYGGRLCGTPIINPEQYFGPESDLTSIMSWGGTARIYGGCLERGTEYNIYDTGYGTIEVYNAAFTKEPNPKFIVGGSEKIIVNKDPITSQQYPYIVAQSEVTISFDLNGGTGNVDSVDGYSGFPITIPVADITKDGYKFLGWSTLPKATIADYVAGDKVSFDKNTTLYAVWEELLEQKITAPKELTLKAGKGPSPIGATTDGDGALSFEVTSGDAVTVDTNGNITPVAVGNATVTVTAAATNNYKEVTKDISITVSEKNPQVIEANDISLKVDEKETLNATLSKGDGTLSFDVFGDSINFNDSTCEIEAIKEGTSTIVITASETEDFAETVKTVTITVTKKDEPANPENLEPDPNEPSDPGDEDLSDPEIPDKDWLDDLRLALRIADELGGERTVEYSGDFALSYDIMKYLEEHPLITLIYHVTYEDVEYTITIPAGKAIADPEIPWYGPLWLLANYGGKTPNATR